MKRLSLSTMNRGLNVLLFAAFLLLPVAAHAGSAVWQETDLEYLWGGNFKSLQDKYGNFSKTAKDNSRSTITVEHADTWKYGDNFFFFDITNPEINRNGAKTSIYGEISPRLSMGRITGTDLSTLFIKDVLLAGTLELGDGFHNYLYGAGLSLKIPKFTFADLDLYVRNDTKKSGVTWQVTPDWQLPFQIGKASFLFEGFVDIAGSEADLAWNVDAQPRLLLDLGNFWGKPGNIYGGTEFIYWHNKFGIKGVDEYAPQVMLKWAL